MAISIAAMMLLIISPSAQAFNGNIQCILTGQSGSIGSCVVAALPLCMIAIIISLMMVGAAYMAGSLFNYNRLKQFYNRELWEIIKSGLIVVFIFSAITIASGISAAFVGGSGYTNCGTVQYTGADKLSNNLAGIYGTVDNAYISCQLLQSEYSFGALLGLSVGSNILRSVNIATWLPVPIPFVGAVQFGSSANLFQSSFITSVYGDQQSLRLTGSSLVDSAANVVILNILSFQIQHDLMPLLAVLGLGVFIPVGIIMRTIPFIRGIGGTLIAIGIGLSIVYPSLLLMFNLPITNYMYALTSSVPHLPACPFSGKLICNFWSGIITFATTTSGFATGSYPLALAFGLNGVGPAATAATVSGQGVYIGLFGPFYNGIFPALNFVVDNSLMQIVQFLLFVLDMIIGVAITDGISTIILGGGSVTKLGVGKFKIG